LIAWFVLILDLAAFFYDYLNVLSVDFDTLNGGVHRRLTDR
jgi:hypothetical protein